MKNYSLEELENIITSQTDDGLAEILDELSAPGVLGDVYKEDAFSLVLPDEAYYIHPEVFYKAIPAMKKAIVKFIDNDHEEYRPRMAKYKEFRKTCCDKNMIKMNILQVYAAYAILTDYKKPAITGLEGMDKLMLMWAYDLYIGDTHIINPEEYAYECMVLDRANYEHNTLRLTKQLINKYMYYNMESWETHLLESCDSLDGADMSKAPDYADMDISSSYKTYDERHAAKEAARIEHEAFKNTGELWWQELGFHSAREASDYVGHNAVEKSNIQIVIEAM